MKKLLPLFSILSIFSFFVSEEAFSAESKYSCYYDLDPASYMGKDMCNDHGNIYSSPEAAAQALSFAKEQFWRSAWGVYFVSFTAQYPECTKLSAPYYAYSCTYNAQERHKDNSGNTISSGYLTHYEIVTLQHSCQTSTVLKGSLGAVITSETDGKRYVLSQSPGETVCATSCNYDVKNTEKCYLTIGSETEGFCNYNYGLKIVNGFESSCVTDSNLKLAEIGDELSDKCPEGFEFANGSKQCTPIPCPIGSERLEGNEACTPIPQQPGGGSGGNNGGTDPGAGTTPGGGDGGTSPGGGGTNPGGGDGGTTPGSGGDGSNPGTGDGGSNPGGSDGDEPFVSPGPLDLSASLSGRGEKVKSQIMDMKQKMVSSDTFTTAKSAFSGSSHAAAVCPVGTVMLFGKDIIFDIHCKLFDLIAPILKAVFMAIWSFLAVRIVLSA